MQTFSHEWSDELAEALARIKNPLKFELYKKSAAHKALKMALLMSLDARMERIYVVEGIPSTVSTLFTVDPRSITALIRRLLETIPELQPEMAESARLAARAILYTQNILIR
jgi:formate dehydrogenase maturation protein FdhE